MLSRFDSQVSRFDFHIAYILTRIGASRIPASFQLTKHLFTVFTYHGGKIFPKRTFQPCILDTLDSVDFNSHFKIPTPLLFFHLLFSNSSKPPPFNPLSVFPPLLNLLKHLSSGKKITSYLKFQCQLLILTPFHVFFLSFSVERERETEKRKKKKEYTVFVENENFQSRIFKFQNERLHAICYNIKTSDFDQLSIFTTTFQNEKFHTINHTFYELAWVR